MSVEVVVGLQRGDEGKGRFVDEMAADFDIVARFNGGANAGHTIVTPEGQELALHQIPSGIARNDKMNIIGNGTLVDPVKLVEEIDDIESKGFEVSKENLLISGAAHAVMPHHICEDEIREAGAGKQGSTKSGIAQVTSHKALRSGIRVELLKNDTDRLFNIAYEALVAHKDTRKALGLDPINEEETVKEYVKSAKKIGEFVTDTVYYLNKELRDTQRPARVLAEGAQAFLLDLDHGMYPYTTSTSTTAGGVCTGLGISPHFIEGVTGIAKAVQSHVGGGPFVTEIEDKEFLRKLHGDMESVDAEKGTTTGRVRRLGYLDLPQIRRAQMVNAIEEMQTLAISKLDWVPRFGEMVKICTKYIRKDNNYIIAPDAAYKLEQCTPYYEELPTWGEDIQEMKHFEDLPKNAQNYIFFVEDQTGIKVNMIGVGPRRDQVIIR